MYFLHRASHQTILAKLFRVIWGNFTSLDWAKLQANFAIVATTIVREWFIVNISRLVHQNILGNSMRNPQQPHGM